MAKLCSHYGAISFFIKHSQPLNEVVKRAAVLCLGHVLKHGQEGLKVHQPAVQF